MLHGLISDEVRLYEPVPAVGRVPRDHEAVHGDVGEGDVARSRGKTLVRAYEYSGGPWPVAGWVER